jgi:hypothetical protein
VLNVHSVIRIPAFAVVNDSYEFFIGRSKSFISSVSIHVDYTSSQNPRNISRKVTKKSQIGFLKSALTVDCTARLVYGVVEIDPWTGSSYIGF